MRESLRAAQKQTGLPSASGRRQARSGAWMIFCFFGRGGSYSVQPSSAASRMAYMALAAWTQSPRVWTGMPRAAMDASIV